VVARSVANSLNLGLYHGGSQVGLTRAVTDLATFAWVGDVFVLGGHRGRGLGHWMIETLRAHPDLAGVRRFMLATSDAHRVYADCGFTPLADPGRYMELRRSPREIYPAARAGLNPLQLNRSCSTPGALLRHTVQVPCPRSPRWPTRSPWTSCAAGAA
jgi:hypothetical protein